MNWLKERFTTDWQRVDWPRTILLVLLILAVFSALWQWLMPQIREINTTQFRRVTQIREVEKVKRVYAPCPEAGVVALDKAEVAKKLDLPWLQDADHFDMSNFKADSTEEVMSPAAAGTPTETRLLPGEDDDHPVPVPGRSADLQVTATADMPETDNGYQLVTVFNTETGITIPLVREKPAPWFEFRNNYGAGIRYGVGLGNGPPRYVGTGYAYWEFLRMKNVYLTGYGEVNTDSEGKAQFDLQWRGGK